MKKLILCALGFALLAGCGLNGPPPPGPTSELKWKGLPYRLELDTKAVKPNPAAITVPPVKFNANPEALENRAIFVMRFTATGSTGPITRIIVGTPLDIHGEQGALPGDYLDRAGKSLTDYLGNHCLQGDVSVDVALARSSVKPQAEEAEVDQKRLSNWSPFKAVYKKPHAKC